jgi:hypothetical protein
MQFTKIAALLSLAVAITASPISLDASLYKNVALPGAVPALPVGVPALRSLPIEVPTLPVGIPTLPVGVPTLAKLPIHVRGIPVPVDSASLLNVLKITQVDIQPALSKLGERIQSTCEGCSNHQYYSRSRYQGLKDRGRYPRC